MKYSWENTAKRNQPMPDWLSSAEQRAFQSLALLTARYKLGGLSPEQAVKERRDIDRAYEHDAYCDKLNDWHIRLTKNIELAHARYRKERTIEAADLLLCESAPVKQVPSHLCGLGRAVVLEIPCEIGHQIVQDGSPAHPPSRPLDDLR